MQVAEAGYVIAQLEIDPPQTQYDGVPLAEVGDGSSGTVHFKGHVKLTKEYVPRNEQLNFIFQASTGLSNDRWGASVFPMIAVMNPRDTTFDVDIFVTAPLYENVREIRHVKIGGSVISNPSMIPGNFTTNSVDVGVAPYIKFVTSSYDSFIRVWPGQDATFKIAIMNMGNRVESFHFQITNIDILNLAGIVVAFPTETIEVAPRNETIFTFKAYGTDQFFHPWRSQMTTINLLITPTNELPEGLRAARPLEDYAQEWFVFYYEFGPEWPDTCYFWTIGIIIFFVAIYKYFKGKSERKRRLKKLLRKQKREQLRKQKLQQE